jgi:CrcB protein
MSKWLAIAIAGGLGSLARYGLAGLVQRWTGPAFPWGTFVVNVVGCLAFGFVVGAIEDRVALGAQLRPFLLVGFLGAFTTFSTFSYESTELLLDRQWWFLAGNAAGQTVVGVAAIIVGLTAGRTV